MPRMQTLFRNSTAAVLVPVACAFGFAVTPAWSQAAREAIKVGTEQTVKPLPPGPIKLGPVEDVRVLVLRSAAAPRSQSAAAAFKFFENAEFTARLRQAFSAQGSPLLAVVHAEQDLAAGPGRLLESARQTGEFRRLYPNLFAGAQRIPDPPNWLVVMVLADPARKDPSPAILEELRMALQQKRSSPQVRREGMVRFVDLLPKIGTGPVVGLNPDPSQGILFNCHSYQGTYWSGTICDCLGSNCGCSGWGWGVCGYNGEMYCSCVLP